MENESELDHRRPGRRTRDEEIAGEQPLAAPEIPSGVVPSPVEAHFGQLRRHPLAVAGIVDNGVVRPLNPAVKLPELSRVIIVASNSEQ